jgi:hypothetical protein
MEVFENDKAVAYLKSRNLIKKYKKAKRYILEGHYQQVQLKKGILILVVFGISELHVNIVRTPKKNKIDLLFLKSPTTNKQKLPT